MSNEEQVTVERAYGYLILRTSRLLRFHFQAMVAEMGIDLSPEQWLLLNRLTLNDGLSQCELIDATFKDRANMSRMIASLERKGLIRRQQDKADGRKRKVYLSAQGRRLHQKLVPVVHRERASVYAGLGERDLDALKRVLDTIDNNILTRFGTNVENETGE